MAGFFDSLFGSSKGPGVKEVFTQESVRKFMDMGNTLAGEEGQKAELKAPEKERRFGDDARVSGSADQVEALMSLFSTRKNTISQRKAQPGQSQSRIV